jgi:hypothetical protein
MSLPEDTPIEAHRWGFFCEPAAAAANRAMTSEVSGIMVRTLDMT